MKRALALALIFLCAMLTGCAQTASSPAMYIEEAQLNQSETAIAKLLGANTQQLICDFKLDETVQSFHLNTYELKDGAWEQISGGGGHAWSGKEGRMALEFDVIPDGMRIAVQNGDDLSATKHTSAVQLDTTGMSRSTAMLSDRTEIVYGQEIPLVLQTYTDQMEHRSYMPETFFTPEVYAEEGFTHVYAITIMFSQEPLK